MLSVYLLFNLKTFDEIYDKNNPTHKYILQLIGVLFVFLVYVYAINGAGRFEFSKTQGDIYNKMLVDSLMNGKVSLDIVPTEELMNMEDPYDFTARAHENVGYLYDYAYYDGNYYVYFSVLPALTLFLPFKLITGYYFPIPLACFIYGAIGAIFTLLFTKDILKKLFPNITFRWITFGVLFMMFSNFVLFNVTTSRVYELVSLMGYMFVMIGMYFVLKAWHEEKTNYKYLSIGCLSLALAVWARPNLVIISLLLVPIGIEKLVKLTKDKQMRDVVKLVLSVAIPYCIVAIAVMFYNYLRFDNILEFGARYQLTSNNVRKLKYSFATIPTGIWHYLFNPFQMLATFPFIHSVDSTPLYVGYYGCTLKGIGIFSLNILMYVLFLLPLLRKNIKQKSKKTWTTIITLVIVGMIMVMLITKENGSYGRYSLDFAWMFALSTILTLHCIYDFVKDNDFTKKIFELVVGACIIMSIFFNSLESINSERNFFIEANNTRYHKVKSSICFWE